MTAANLVDLVVPQPGCDVLMRTVQCCYAWNMESGVANLCRFKYKSENYTKQRTTCHARLEETL